MQLKSEGIGIFLISHDIHDVFDLADRISVMLQGKLVGTVNKAEVTKDEVLAMIIIGKMPGEVSRRGDRRNHPVNETRVRPCVSFDGSDYQPRSIHSWRCGRSVPIVVSAPWPGSTIVSSGNVNSFDVDRRDDRVEVAVLERGVAGAAGEQRVAGEQQRRAVERERHRARGVAGVVDRVEPEAADLDHLGVVDEHVVADVLQHRRVERR